MKHFKLLLATMLAFVCTTGVWADEITLNGVTYALSDNATTATVIKIPSTDTSLTIPATITYNGTSYAVKYIRLYEVNSTLTDLTVEGQIDSFDGRTQSGSITNAFTSLKNLTFKQLVSEIYEQSFYRHPTLESVKFEGGVEVIGQFAFNSCHQLKTIDFGTRLFGLLEIHQLAFYQCSSLEEVIFPAETRYVNINKHAFYYCSKLAHVVFPDDWYAYWDFNLGDECFTRSTENIVVKIPYGRADYFKKYFNRNANYEEYPSPVTFSVAAGRYEEAQTVEIANTWGTSIYYTTDGSDPLVNGQEYTGAIIVDKTMVIRAYATRTPTPARPANWCTSPVVEAKYVIGKIPKEEITTDYLTFNNAGDLAAWVNQWGEANNYKTWTRLLFNRWGYLFYTNSADWATIRMLCGVDSEGNSNDFAVHYLDISKLNFKQDTNPFLTVDSQSYGIDADNELSSYAFHGMTQLDTLLLPSSVTAIGADVFGSSYNPQLGVYAPWASADKLPTLIANSFGANDDAVKNMTLIVPRGSLAVYKNADHWKAFGNIVEVPMSSDEEQVTVLCGTPSVAVQAYMNGNTYMGTVDTETGLLTFIMDKTGTLQLRVPTGTHVVSKIFINNVDETANFTVTPSNDFVYYQHSALTENLNSVYIQFEPVPVKDLIEFADTEVKRICVENWDTDGDHELSKAEAAAVTTLKKDNGDGTFGDPVFKENSVITSFDELQYFTGLTTIDEYAFHTCTALVSVKLPDGVKTLHNYSFKNCSSLQHIQLPEGLDKLNTEVFANTGLTSIFIPKSVTSVSFDAFVGCAQLQSIVVEEGTSKYSSPNGCNAVIWDRSPIIMLQSGCRNTVIPDNVLMISQKAFKGQTELTKIVIPSSVSIINQEAFYGCSNLTSVVVERETPATLGTSAFGGISADCILTVPAGCAAAYADWAQYFKEIVEEPAREDLNNDGQVNIADVTKLVNKVVGKE